jgi:hypothetical protein
MEPDTDSEIQLGHRKHKNKRNRIVDSEEDETSMLGF